METISGISNWNLTARREGNGVTILRAGTCEQNAVLPDQLFGLPVVALGDHALAPGRQSEQTFPGAETVRITCGLPDETAVWDNQNLQDLSLPECLTSIGNYALLNCSNLKTLRIYDKITRWGGGVLMNCRNLDTLYLTRTGPDQGEALAWFAGELSRELDVTIQDCGETVRLLFPEYTELYEENCPAHHFDYFISGAGYPYHHVFQQKKLLLNGYDRLWRDFLGTEHEDSAALRLAWYRLRWPVGLSDEAKADYRAYLRDHAEDALRFLLAEGDADALPFLLAEVQPDRATLSAACALARELEATAALAVLLEELHRRFPAGMENPLDYRRYKAYARKRFCGNWTRYPFASRNELYMNLPYLDTALCALEFAPGGGVTLSLATDGESLYYDGSWLAERYMRNRVLTNRAYLHVILHCMLRHLAKKRGKVPELWDLACDVSVESILDELDYPCLGYGAAPVRRKFYGECRQDMPVLTAEGIYRRLLRLDLPEYQIAQLQRAFLVDDHGLWSPEKQDDQDQSQRQDQAWQDISSRTQTGLETVLAGKGTGGEAVLEQVRVAVRDDVDYRAFLRRFAAPREIQAVDGDAFDYGFYSYGLRLYGNMPLVEPPETREEKRIEDFVIAVDTSMSTSGQRVREFLACTYAILRSSGTFTRKVNVRIIQCDDQIRSDTAIHDLEDLREYMECFELTGGSATDFRPVFEHVAKLQAEGAFTSLRGLLYFTDGMGIYPEKRTPYETAFVLLGEPPQSVKTPPWAIRLVLEASDLERAAEDFQLEEQDLNELPEL